jgi:hypothetical protein
MPAPKPLPFDRVRVILDAEAGACAAAVRRRPALASLHTLERSRFEARAERRASPSAAAAAGRAAAALGVPAEAAREPPTENAGEPAPDTEPGTAASLPWSGGGEQERDESGEPAAEPLPAAAQAEPEDRAVSEAPAQAGSRLGALSPVAAVARVVEETSFIHALAELLSDTCGDEALLETGPWEFSLQLKSVGLGASSVDLVLSRELLQLRFHCRGAGVAGLLLRHQETLVAMLQRELPGPPDIDIAWVND